MEVLTHSACVLVGDSGISAGGKVGGLLGAVIDEHSKLLSASLLCHSTAQRVKAWHGMVFIPRC